MAQATTLNEPGQMLAGKFMEDELRHEENEVALQHDLIIMREQVAEFGGPDDGDDLAALPDAIE